MWTKVGRWDVSPGDTVRLDDGSEVTVLDTENDVRPLSCGCCADIVGWRLVFARANGEQDSVYLDDCEAVEMLTA